MAALDALVAMSKVLMAVFQTVKILPASLAA
jgi:hypothetical protein